MLCACPLSPIAPSIHVTTVADEALVPRMCSCLQRVAYHIGSAPLRADVDGFSGGQCLEDASGDYSAGEYHQIGVSLAASVSAIRRCSSSKATCCAGRPSTSPQGA